MIQLQFYSLLRLMLNKESMNIPYEEGDTVRQVLDRVFAAVDVPIAQNLIDGNGVMHTGTIILVNRNNILHLNGLETSVRDGDILALFPPGAGG